MNKNRKGFVSIIIILIMAVIILSLLGVNFNILFKNKALQENFKLVWDFLKFIWNKYVLRPSIFIWTIMKRYVK